MNPVLSTTTVYSATNLCCVAVTCHHHVVLTYVARDVEPGQPGTLDKGVHFQQSIQDHFRPILSDIRRLDEKILTEVPRHHDGVVDDGDRPDTGENQVLEDFRPDS